MYHREIISCCKTIECTANEKGRVDLGAVVITRGWPCELFWVVVVCFEDLLYTFYRATLNYTSHELPFLMLCLLQ